MKIRHILLVLLVLLAIAFMQPLITFLGGLTLLIGVGILIFRDLPPAVQETVERRLLDGLRRARADARAELAASPLAKDRFPATPGGPPGLPERTRRPRVKAAPPPVADPAGNGGSTPPSV